MRPRATDRLLVAIVAAAAGALVALLAGLPEAAVLVTPWVALLVLGFMNRRPSDVRASVEVGPVRVLVGDDVEVRTSVAGCAGTLRVTCLSGPALWPPGGDSDGRQPAAHDVLVDGAATVSCSLTASRWGTYDLGRVDIEMTEPYGLFRQRAEAGQWVKVRVHPNQTELQNLLAPWFVRRVSGAHLSRAVGSGVEYADVREYSSGDSLRDINWRVSARSTELWVSERHPDRATDVVLLLDSFIESRHDVRTVVGLAIEAAVALAESHLAVTDRVGLVELGGVVRWVTPGAGRLHLQRLTDVLLSTGLYANAADRDLHGVPPRVLPPRSFVIALTPLLDDRFIDALFVLGGRGHDVGVIECDPLAAGTAGVDDPLQAVAHRMWEAERQVVRDKLAEHGIAVVGWRSGEHLDLTLRELIRRRRRTLRAGRR